VLGRLNTGLRRTGQVGIVNRTTAGPIANAIHATSCHAFIFAVILGVHARIGVDTLSILITNHACVAVTVGVYSDIDDMAVARIDVVLRDACVAGFGARSVAAVPVDAEAGGTLDTLVAGIAWVLGRDADTIVIAVITGNTVIVIRTTVEAVECFIVADVGLATLRATIIADAATIAGIGKVEDIDIAGLCHADGAEHPLVAGTGAVAVPVGTTSGLLFDRAITLRIGIHECCHAGAIRTTHEAGAAVAFRVSLFRVTSAGTLIISKVAGLAVVGAGILATNTIDAEVRLALVAGRGTGAGFAVVLLNDTGGTIAPGVRRTLRIGEAGGVAGKVAIANIRIANGQALIGAESRAITDLGAIFKVFHTVV